MQHGTQTYTLQSNNQKIYYQPFSTQEPPWLYKSYCLSDMQILPTSILQPSLYMNHHLAASLSYQLADLYQLVGLKPPKYVSYIAELLWGCIRTSVE